MSKRPHISMQTRKNWLIDAAVFFGGLLAALSGIYFLFLPTGGYQGGRNPAYGINILFSRQTWDVLHTWTGVVMIAAVAIHLAIHWRWVRMMARRAWNALLSRGNPMSTGAKFNVAINVIIGLGFLLCALSGLYFLFVPSGGLHGGSTAAWDPNLLWSRTTWDLIHTWSGVTLIAAAVVHFAIHWRWVKNVTAKFFLSLLPQRKPDPLPATG
jgi:hypothetical protein